MIGYTGIRNFSRAIRIKPADCVTPPSSGPAQSSIRSAPASCAARAEGKLNAHISSSILIMTFYRHHSFLSSILYRVRESRLDRISACLPPLVQRDKGHLDILSLFTLDPDDPFHYRLTSLLRPHPLSHTLHDRMTAAYPDDILTLTRRRNRPDLVVDKQPRSDDRRITQPPPHLEPHPA